MSSAEPLIRSRFPRAAEYHPEWILASASGGANSLCLTEWLTSAMDLRSEMNVLDLGCGRAASSIFAAREYSVTVWATDLWFSPTENAQRIRDAGLQRNVYAIHSDARNLPFANEFFDAILSIDAIPYFGTDDHYLSYLARFVKPDGCIAIALAGFTQELEGEIPTHLTEWLGSEPSMRSMHSAPWWGRHWQNSGKVDVQVCDSMPEGWQLWLDWLKTVAPENELEIRSLEEDQGRYLTYNRVIARRLPHARFDEPILSIPTNYTQKPLLRDQSQAER